MYKNDLTLNILQSLICKKKKKKKKTNINNNNNNKQIFRNEWNFSIK